MPPSREILCPNFLEMQKRRQVFNASSHILSQHDNVYCIQYGSVSFLTLEFRSSTQVIEHFQPHGFCSIFSNSFLNNFSKGIERYLEAKKDIFKIQSI